MGCLHELAAGGATVEYLAKFHEDVGQHHQNERQPVQVDHRERVARSVGVGHRRVASVGRSFGTNVNPSWLTAF